MEIKDMIKEIYETKLKNKNAILVYVDENNRVPLKGISKLISSKVLIINGCSNYKKIIEDLIKVQGVVYNKNKVYLILDMDNISEIQNEIDMYFPATLLHTYNIWLLNTNTNEVESDEY